MLHGAFSHEFEESWIIAAAEHIERGGTTEWAPTSNGDYYENPDQDPEAETPPSPAAAQLTREIFERLTALEDIVATLPTTPLASAIIILLRRSSCRSTARRMRQASLPRSSKRGPRLPILRPTPPS